MKCIECGKAVKDSQVDTLVKDGRLCFWCKLKLIFKENIKIDWNSFVIGFFIGAIVFVFLGESYIRSDRKDVLINDYPNCKIEKCVNQSYFSNYSITTSSGERLQVWVRNMSYSNQEMNNEKSK